MIVYIKLLRYVQYAAVAGCFLCLLEDDLNGKNTREPAIIGESKEANA